MGMVRANMQVTGETEGETKGPALVVSLIKWMTNVCRSFVCVVTNVDPQTQSQVLVSSPAPPCSLIGVIIDSRLATLVPCYPAPLYLAGFLFRFLCFEACFPPWYSVHHFFLNQFLFRFPSETSQ